MSERGAREAVRRLDLDVRTRVKELSHAREIIHEIYRALERLEAPADILSIVGSYGDTLPDEQVLQYLKDWNAGGKIMQERQ